LLEVPPIFRGQAEASVGSRASRCGGNRRCNGLRPLAACLSSIFITDTYTRFSFKLGKILSFVQNVAITPTPAEASAPIKHFSAPVVLGFLFLASLWFVLCHSLSGEWLVNEQYNYGWFVPFFALYLFWLRWQDRPEIESRKPKVEVRHRHAIVASIGVLALLLLLPVRLFEIGNPDWRPLGWLHAAITVSITLALIWAIGGKKWLMHFAFPVAFIFVSVPWVTPVEVPIVQGMMRTVAAITAEMATWFGIPTHLEGNLIRIPGGVVGVNEACSGVRSLQTSLMIGLLFGELKRFSEWHRVLLVIGAIAIAFIGNCGRAFFLVWIAATKGIAAIGHWHDLAGYAIVAAVFAASLTLATLLGRQKRINRRDDLRVVRGYSEDGTEPVPPSNSPIIASSLVRLPTACFVVALCWLVFVEVASAAWYRWHERNLVATIGWDVKWPQTAPNFQKVKIDQDVRRILRFDEGQGAAWTWPVAGALEAHPENSRTITCFVYLFRWNAGRNSVLLANLHRPDVCLPAIGWHQVADTGVRNYPVRDSFALPFRHFEFRNGTAGSSAQQTADAFYCLSEDRVSGPSAAGSKSQMAGAPSTWTRDERIRQVLEGRRHLGQQVMEVIFITREPIAAADAESRFAELVQNIVVTKPAPNGLREDNR
jgi:exosortase